MIAFVTFSLTHSQLNTADIFASLALFNGLRMPLNMLPVVLGQTIDAYISLKRIQSYLIAEEEVEARKIDPSQEEAIKIKNASFTWEASGKGDEDAPKSDKPPESQHSEAAPETVGSMDTLTHVEDQQTPFHFENLDLSFHRNELVAVVGSVGSGKTSILAAIAGDMRMTSGSVSQGANMAYCPQYSWIQNATVRDNITFGKEFNQEFYDKVVLACALKADFDMLPQGDQTEVGERGITLSGGQKQRLNIARSIYFNSEIVLLDDPLSAVDAHVGAHIMSEAICGLLSGKCRILATHQLHVLSQCDRILWLQNGKVAAFSTYEELMATEPAFEQMLSMTAKEKKAVRPEADDNSYDTDNEEKIEIEKLEKKLTSNRNEPKGAPVALMEAEEKAEDSVSFAVYAKYIRASGTIWFGPFVLLMCALSQTAQIMGTLWLGYWTSGTYGLQNNVYVSHRSYRLLSRTDHCARLGYMRHWV